MYPGTNDHDVWYLPNVDSAMPTTGSPGIILVLLCGLEYPPSHHLGILMKRLLLVSSREGPCRGRLDLNHNLDRRINEVRGRRFPRSPMRGGYPAIGPQSIPAKFILARSFGYIQARCIRGGKPHVVRYELLKIKGGVVQKNVERLRHIRTLSYISGPMRNHGVVENDLSSVFIKSQRSGKEKGGIRAPPKVGGFSPLRPLSSRGLQCRASKVHTRR